MRKNKDMYLRKCGLLAIALTLCLLVSTVRTGVNATDPDLVLTEDLTDAALTETDDSESGSAEVSAELAEDEEVVVVSEEVEVEEEEILTEADETEVDVDAEIVVISEEDADVLAEADTEVISEEYEEVSLTAVSTEVEAETIEDTTEYVAYIYDQGYATLEEAIDAAAEGDTITLTADITASSTIVVNKNLTIDFQGHTVDSYLSGWDNWSFAVRKYVTVRFENGTINSCNTMILTQGDVYLSNMTINSIGEAWCAIGVYYCASLTVESDSVINAVDLGIHVWSQNYVYGEYDPGVTLDIYGKIHAGTYAIKGSISDRTGTTINIYKGAYITSDTEAAIYHPQPNSYLNIYGGIISGATGIEMGGGTLYVDPYSDAIISGTASFSFTGASYDTSVTGVAVLVSQSHGAYPVIVDICGGTFIGSYALYESNLHNIENLSTTIYVEGGLFFGDVGAAYISDLVDGAYVATIVGGAYTTDPQIYVPDGIPVSYLNDLFYVGLELTGDDTSEDEEETPVEEPVEEEEETPVEETEEPVEEEETPVETEEPEEENTTEETTVEETVETVEKTETSEETETVYEEETSSETEETTVEVTETPTEEPEEEIIHTGQLNWPIPVLLILSVVCLFFGMRYLKKEDKKDEAEKEE